MPGDIVLLELVLHETAGNPQQFCRMGLNEIRTDKGAFDEGGFDTVQRVCQIELNRQKVNSTFELGLLTADFRGEVFYVDDLVGHHDHASFEHVLKLTYVARPVISGEVVLSLNREALCRDPIIFSDLFAEMSDAEEYLPGVHGEGGWRSEQR